MSAGNNIVVVLVGRTGDGKSTLGNEILKRLGNTSSPFGVGSEANAHTHSPMFVVAGNVMVGDHPGLMDTNGQAQDAQNINNIVVTNRANGHINTMVLVVNAKAIRFDNGMQVAVKLIADSFGVGVLRHMVVAYTNCYGVDSQMLQGRTNEIMQLINTRCGSQLTQLGHYAVENKPEIFPDLTPEAVTRIRDQSHAQIDSLLVDSRNQPRYDTRYAVVAETDDARRAREAREQAQAAASAQALAEQRAREAAAAAERERAAAAARVAEANRIAAANAAAAEQARRDQEQAERNRQYSSNFFEKGGQHLLSGSCSVQ